VSASASCAPLGTVEDGRGGLRSCQSPRFLSPLKRATSSSRLSSVAPCGPSTSSRRGAEGMRITKSPSTRMKKRRLQTDARTLSGGAASYAAAAMFATVTASTAAGLASIRRCTSTPLSSKASTSASSAVGGRLLRTVQHKPDGAAEQARSARNSRQRAFPTLATPSSRRSRNRSSGTATVPRAMSRITPKVKINCALALVRLCASRYDLRAETAGALRCAADDMAYAAPRRREDHR
jgi:hypothetical protein